jgi:hypothetical protein
MKNDEENPYQSPEERGTAISRPRRPVSTTMLTIAILMGIMASVLLSLQPRFASMFEDMDVQLPTISRLAFNPVLAYLTGFVALAAFLNAIVFPSDKDTLLNVAYFVFGLLVVALVLFGVVFPLLSIVQALS